MKLTILPLFLKNHFCKSLIDLNSIILNNNNNSKNNQSNNQLINQSTVNFFLNFSEERNPDQK